MTLIFVLLTFSVVSSAANDFFDERTRSSNNKIDRNAPVEAIIIGKGKSSSPFSRHIDPNNSKRYNKPRYFHTAPYVAFNNNNPAGKNLKLLVELDTRISKPNYHKKTTNYKAIKPQQNRKQKLQSNPNYETAKPNSFAQSITFPSAFKASYPKLNQKRFTVPLQRTIISNPYQKSILQKNYRNDNTHEPVFTDDDFLQNKPLIVPKTQSDKGELHSVHEVPKYIPVKPVYPGEGKWAVKELKHKPYVGQQTYTTLDDTVEHPEGEEIFENAKNVFEAQRQKFPAGFLAPKQEDYNNYDENDDSRENEKESGEFVPTRTLAQVRKYESEKHNLPPIEPRLREVIKDSKTHTVFTEEGYEDAAYDHADHEKKAEQEEGSEEFRKIQDIKKSNPKVVDQSENEQDESETSETQKIVEIPEITMEQNESKTEEQFQKDYGFKSENIDRMDENKDPKYPYYKSSKLDENSPLRYSENLNNILQKQEGKMSFYNQAQRKKCQEIKDVNPVPKRIEDHVEGKTKEIEEDEDQSGGPRINLGDQIECYKEQLFGENPLDSPLFTDPIEVKPAAIFEEIKSLDIQQGNIDKDVPSTFLNRVKRQSSNNQLKTEEINDQLDQVEKQALHFRRNSIRKKIKPRRKFTSVPYSRGPYVKPPKHPTTHAYPITVLPKYKTVSEVQYKEDIKPNEQLNVFTDVIQNIKMSSEIFDQDNFGASPKKIEIKAFTVPKKNKQNFSFQTIEENIKEPQVGDSNVIEAYAPSEKYHEQRKKNPIGKTEYIDKHFNLEKNTLKSELERVQNKNFVNINNNEFILGMKPPPPYLLQPRRPSRGTPKNKLLRHKLPKRRVHNKYRRRYKRSAPKRSYSQIRRANNEETTEEEEDDYVPRRNRNYYYDEKSKKIVYITTERSQQLENTNDDFVPVTTERITTTTTEKEVEKGPSFLEYLAKVKSHESYVYIPDPKKEELNPNSSTTTTTLKPVSTTTPEFLKILQMVKNNPEYKEIGKKNSSTTTEENVMAEDEEKEVLQTQNIPVKNSPGNVHQVSESSDGSKSMPMDNVSLKIFDISEYIPRPRSYNFSSYIDTSKYTTIQRTPSKKPKEEVETAIDEPQGDRNQQEKKLTDSETLRVEENKNVQIESVTQKTHIEEQPKSGRVHRRFRGRSRNRGNNNRTRSNEPPSENRSNEELPKNQRKQRIQKEEKMSSDVEEPPKIDRIRREEPRSFSLTSTDEQSSTSTTEAIEISSTTVRSRGKARHRSSYQTSTTPRYRRGRRTRPTKDPSVPSSTTSSTIFRRRRPISSNAPVTTTSSTTTTRTTERVLQLQDDISATTSKALTLETVELENRNGELDNNNRAASHVSPRKVQDVEVFKEYDRKQKHGGNYKRIEDVEGGDSGTEETKNTSQDIDDEQDNNYVSKNQIKRFEMNEKVPVNNHDTKPIVSNPTLLAGQKEENENYNGKMLVKVLDVPSSTRSPELEASETGSQFRKNNVDINNPNHYIDRVSLLKDVKKDVTISPEEYILNNGGRQFTEKEDTEVLDRSTKMPVVHRTVKKRIRVKSTELVPPITTTVKIPPEQTTNNYYSDKVTNNDRKENFGGSNYQEQRTENLKENKSRLVKKIQNDEMPTSTEKFYYIKDPSKRNYFYAPV